MFPGFFSMTLTSKEEVTEETKMLKKTMKHFNFSFILDLHIDYTLKL